jgi:Ca2+-binding RTX toxin-like protein
VITEAANQGTDRVNVNSDGNVDVTFTLPTNIEEGTMGNLGDRKGTLIGNTLNNLLIGNGEGVGTFLLNGGAGNDTLTGSIGNDTLIGGTGADSQLGGAGSDVFLYASPAEFVAGESVNGEADSDVLRFTSATPGATLVLSGTVQVESVAITNSAGLITTTALNINAAGVTNALSIVGNNGANTLTGTALPDTLSGNSGNDVLIGGDGNDLVIGGAGADNLQGGLGDDVIRLHALADFAAGEMINGGAGTDTLQMLGNLQVFDLGAIANNRIVGIEVVLVGADTMLVLGLSDVLDLSDTTNTLRVDGVDNSIVSAGQGWIAGGQQVIGPNTYNSYTSGAATLLVDTDISQTIS